MQREKEMKAERERDGVKRRIPNHYHRNRRIIVYQRKRKTQLIGIDDG